MGAGLIGRNEYRRHLLGDLASTWRGWPTMINRIGPVNAQHRGYATLSHSRTTLLASHMRPQHANNESDYVQHPGNRWRPACLWGPEVWYSSRCAYTCSSNYPGTGNEQKTPVKSFCLVKNSKHTGSQLNDVAIPTWQDNVMGFVWSRRTLSVVNTCKGNRTYHNKDVLAILGFYVFCDRTEVSDLEGRRPLR